MSHFQAVGQFRSCYISNSLEALRKLQASGVDIRNDEKAVLDSGFTFYRGKFIAHTLLPEIVNNLENFITQPPSWKKLGGVDTVRFCLNTRPDRPLNSRLPDRSAFLRSNMH